MCERRVDDSIADHGSLPVKINGKDGERHYLRFPEATTIFFLG